MGNQQVKEPKPNLSTLGAVSSIRSSRKPRVPKDSRIIGSNNIFTEHHGKFLLCFSLPLCSQHKKQKFHLEISFEGHKKWKFYARELFASLSFQQILEISLVICAKTVICDVSSLRRAIRYERWRDSPDCSRSPSKELIFVLCPAAFLLHYLSCTQNYEFTASICVIKLHKFIIEALHKWALVSFQHDFINLPKEKHKKLFQYLIEIIVYPRR